jgi:ribosome-binding factor A
MTSSPLRIICSSVRTRRLRFIDLKLGMAIDRTVRVSEVIRRELSLLMGRSGELEGLFITISGVKTLPDLKQAFVYLSVIDQAVPNGQILELLNKCKKEWQRELGQRMGTKFTPRLTFEIDNTIERGDRIMQVLQEIESGQKPEQPAT